MKKRTKWILGIIIVLFLGSSFILPITGKLIFEQKVGEILQRKVHLGSLGFNLLTGTVELRDLRIPNEKGFQEKNLFQMGKFSLRISLLPLIFRRIVIQKILILKPQIVIERDKKGRINIQELRDKLIKGEGKGTPPALVDFSLKKLILKKGKIIFVDGKIDHPPFVNSLDDIMIKVFGISTRSFPDSLNTKFKMEANLATPHPTRIKSWARGNFIGEKISFEANFAIQKLEIPHFSLYYKKQIPAAVTSGTLSINSKTCCKNSILDSWNHILIEDLNLIPHKKGKKTFLGIPISQIVKFLRTHQGRIEFDFPVTGDLKNPEYHLFSAVGQVFGGALKEKVGKPLEKVGRKTGKGLEKGGKYLGKKVEKLFRKERQKK